MTRGTKQDHPLMQFVPTVLDSFEAWFEVWQKTERLDEKLGLLHALTAERSWWPRQELVFTLLDTADGFNDRSNFKSDCPGNWESDHAAEKRWAIAKKAFTILCQRFFRDGRDRHGEPAWWWMLEHEVLFCKVLWFLRKKESFTWMVNPVRESMETDLEHPGAVYRNFVSRFAKLAWDFTWPQNCRRWDDKTDEIVQRWLVAARPQLLIVLDELRELSWLGNRDLILDKLTIGLLTEMALNVDCNLPDGYHKPERLGEAVLGGSVAAKIVVLEKFKERERRRFKAKRKAQQEKREQERRAQELARLEQERKDLEEKTRRLAEESSSIS